MVLRCHFPYFLPSVGVVSHESFFKNLANCFDKNCFFSLKGKNRRRPLEPSFPKIVERKVDELLSLSYAGRRASFDIAYPVLNWRGIICALPLFIPLNEVPFKKNSFFISKSSFSSLKASW